MNGKQVKIDFCEEILFVPQEYLPKYQAKAQELMEIAIKAGYTESQAKQEYYLKILNENK